MPHAPDSPEWFSANPPGLTETLARRHAFVAGAGGLGSNVAALLVRAGIGRLTIVDFDVVAPSNLNRQFYFRDQVGQSKVTALADNLRRINPTAALSLHAETLTPASCPHLVPNDADVLCECLDRAEAKAMLAAFCRQERPCIPLICVSGLAGIGPAESMAVHRQGDKFFVIGDGQSEMTPEAGTVSARVMAAAALQAQLAIRLLAGLHEA
jgi:sulfur carrier protein ThiS adenylyltransferase